MTLVFAFAAVAALGLVGLPPRDIAGGDRRRRSRPATTGDRPQTAIPVALLLDLVAAVLDAGAPPAAAVRSVGEALAVEGDPVSVRHAARLTQYGNRLSAGTPASGTPGRGSGGEAGDERVFAALWGALELASAAGVSPAAPVRQASATARRRATAAHLVALRRLEVRLVLPTGLCLLPAFVLLGVAPVVLDLIGG